VIVSSVRVPVWDECDQRQDDAVRSVL